MNKQKIVLGVLGVIFAAMILQYCDRRKVKQITDTNLTKDEQVAIIVNPNDGSITTVRRNRKNKKDTTQVQRPIDGSRDIRIGVSPEGRVKFTARTKGFIFEPGIGVGFDGDSLLAVDAQFYFVRNWGVIGGVAVPMDSFRGRNLRLYVAGSYQLPFQKFRNTSVYAGYNTKKEIQVGARIRF